MKKGLFFLLASKDKECPISSPTFLPMSCGGVMGVGMNPTLELIILSKNIPFF